MSKRSIVFQHYHTAAFASCSASDPIQFRIIYSRYLRSNAQMAHGIRLTLSSVIKRREGFTDISLATVEIVNFCSVNIVYNKNTPYIFLRKIEISLPSTGNRKTYD